MNIRVVFVVIFLLRIGLNLSAQDSLKVIDALYTDFSIPDASAAGLLGINPANITRPSSTKELAASMVNVANGGKGISPGIALEWAPLLTFDKKMVRFDSIRHIYSDLAQYNRSFLKRNFSLSYASIQDSSGSKIAFGFSILLCDKADPGNSEAYALDILERTGELLIPLTAYTDIRMSFAAFYDSQLKLLELDEEKNPAFYDHAPLETARFDEGSLSPNRDSIIKIFTDELKIASDKDKRLDIVKQIVDQFYRSYELYRKSLVCDKLAFKKLLEQKQRDFKKEHWNDMAVKIGVGNIWNSGDNSWKKLQPQEAAGYISAAFPVGKRFGQLATLCQGAYNWESDSVNLAQMNFGARFLFGTNWIHGSVEFCYQYHEFRKKSPADIKSEDIIRSTAGLEVMINDGFWLEFGVGVVGDYEKFSRDAKMLGMADLKYTFKKEARFKL